MYPMTRVIARREFSEQGRKRTKPRIVVEIGEPKFGGPEWYCPVRIRGIDSHLPYVTLFGVDAVQALVNGLAYAGLIVKHQARREPERFADWEETLNFGFPRLPTVAALEKHRARVLAARRARKISWSSRRSK